MGQTYKSLTHRFELPNLYPEQIINRKELIEKCQFMHKYAEKGQRGIYAVDERYRECGEIGLHYYFCNTMVEYLQKYSADRLRVMFTFDHRLQFVGV